MMNISCSMFIPHNILKYSSVDGDQHRFAFSHVETKYKQLAGKHSN